jgi:hypothetical protein
VRLIVKTTSERDFAQWVAVGEHELRGQFHAPAHDVGVGRLSVSKSECSREVSLAEIDEVAQIGHQNLLIDVFFDVVLNQPHLPGQQRLGGVRPVVPHLRLQEGGGSMDRGFGSLPGVLQLETRTHQQIDDAGEHRPHPLTALGRQFEWDCRSTVHKNRRVACLPGIEASSAGAQH